MLSFRKFYYLKEGFDNVLDFLLNPEHRNKTWSELMQEFEESGGKFIGSGKYGSVYSHPSWNYVLKMFFDPHYLKFVRFANRNPHPSFPKFYGTAQRIIPFFRRTKNMITTYIIRIEKLNPLTDHLMSNAIIGGYYSAIRYFEEEEKGKGNEEYEKSVIPSLAERRQGILTKKVTEKIHKAALDLFARYPQSKNLCHAIYLVHKNIKDAALDIHDGNIMQRDNGELVLIDPLWSGSNPYADARAALDAEIGYEGPDEPEDIIGGKLPKRPRKKKQKPTYSYDNPNEIPF